MLIRVFNCLFMVLRMKVILLVLGLSRWWNGDCCLLCLVWVKWVFLRKLNIVIGMWLNLV